MNTANKALLIPIPRIPTVTHNGFQPSFLLCLLESKKMQIADEVKTMFDFDDKAIEGTIENGYEYQPGIIFANELEGQLNFINVEAEAKQRKVLKPSAKTALYIFLEFKVAIFDQLDITDVVVMHTPIDGCVLGIHKIGARQVQIRTYQCIDTPEEMVLADTYTFVYLLPKQ